MSDLDHYGTYFGHPHDPRTPDEEEPKVFHCNGCHRRITLADLDEDDRCINCGECVDTNDL